MSCYRLTFKNDRVFEIEIDSVEVVDELAKNVCTGVMYRVINGAREFHPLQRSDGGPIQVIAMSESATLDIATHVLMEVTGSTLDKLGKCGTRTLLPPLPEMA
jgi:hypothetical protein